MIYKLVDTGKNLSCDGCVFRGKGDGYRACSMPRNLEPCGDDIYVIAEIKNV